jgi:peptidoglycan-associated lipoprotein
MSKWILMALVATLAACSTPVKLDETSVEDKSSQGSGAVMKALTPATTGTASSNAGSVASLDASPTAKSAVGAERIVYFDFDSFAIRPEFQGIIESNARTLKGNKAAKISIEGHTDERGGREYNLALGQKRSEAVRKALGLLGVSEAQMEAVSFGKEKPVAQGSDESAYTQNRRAALNYQ